MNDKLTINTIIKSIEDAYPPVDPGNKFFKEVDHFFCGNESFKRASSELVDEPLCMLELKAQVRETFTSFKDIASLMYEIWRELAYDHFEASSCTHYRQASVLKFVTVPSFQDYYISGHMIVNAVKQEHIAAQYEKDLAGAKELSNLPAGIESI